MRLNVCRFTCITCFEFNIIQIYHKPGGMTVVINTISKGIKRVNILGKMSVNASKSKHEQNQHVKVSAFYR